MGSIAVLGLLVAVASLVLEQGSRGAGFSSCSMWAQQLWCVGFVAPSQVKSSQTRDWTLLPCFGRGILDWTTGEVPLDGVLTEKMESQGLVTVKHLLTLGSSDSGTQQWNTRKEYHIMCLIESEFKEGEWESSKFSLECASQPGGRVLVESNRSPIFRVYGSYFLKA